MFLATSSYNPASHLALLNRHQAGHQRHQLVLVKAAEDPVEHELRGEQLIGSVQLAGRSPLELHHPLCVDVAQLAEYC